jgi:tetratricopeptide (TPR) repeat protein
MTENNNSKLPADAADGVLIQALERALESLLQEPRQAQAQAALRDADAEDPAFSSACPEPSAWIQLATGKLQTAALDSLLVHAALCQSCAPRLRESISLFSPESTPEEAAEAPALLTSALRWQRQLAVDLAQTLAKPQPGRFARYYLWAGAGIAATLVFSATLTGWWLHAHTPERLLAESYTHDRLFDLRMSGAGFAPVNAQAHLRGGMPAPDASRLLEARGRIEQQLVNKPGDPRWMQLEARADLLQEKFDAAIGILDPLLAAAPATPSLLLDDAVAYYQRGIDSGSESDRAKALEALRRADELVPDHSVVLFNEAVVMEDRGQLMNAVETWNRYLRFERDPRWLAEGNRRLQELKAKLDRLKTHQSWPGDPVP